MFTAYGSTLLLLYHTVILKHNGGWKLILYKYWLHERVTWEIVTPRKPRSTEAKPKWCSTILIVWFQNNPGQVNICACIFVLRLFKRSYDARIYGEPYAHKFCAVDNFWNVTRRQAILPVATFHHVFGRGFMIPRAILIFIKCLPANQNQQFYVKVWYYRIIHL